MTNRKRIDQIALILCSIVAVVVLIIISFNVMQPKRSVESYCKIYKLEDAKLASTKGGTYSVSVFAHSSDKPSDFVDAFTRLERVAPNEISSDVNTLKQVFSAIDKDPAQRTNASISGLTSEAKVKSWTLAHCDSNKN